MSAGEPGGDAGNIPASEPVFDRSPVMAELFTSEGCSSCPPADRLLTMLAMEQPVAKARVITLEFHVDYWDNSAWKDRFSSAAYTVRQEMYAKHFGIGSTYTPQMVIDGEAELVGSNRSGVIEAISSGSSHKKASVAIDVAGNHVQVKISGLGKHKDATVYLAIVESKLGTHVGGGENAGDDLEHTSVVRQLETIGTIAGADDGFSVDKIIAANAEWKNENVRYVVFVQDDSTLKVLGVNRSGL